MCGRNDILCRETTCSFTSFRSYAIPVLTTTLAPTHSLTLLHMYVQYVLTGCTYHHTNSNSCTYNMYLQVVELVPNEGAKWSWLAQNVDEYVAEGKVLIFVLSKTGVEELTSSLRRYNC